MKYVPLELMILLKKSAYDALKDSLLGPLNVQCIDIVYEIRMVIA